MWHYVSDSSSSLSIIIDSDGSAIFVKGSKLIALDMAGNLTWRHSISTLADPEMGRPFSPGLAPGGVVLMTSGNSGASNYIYAMGRSTTVGLVVLVVSPLTIAATVFAGIRFWRRGKQI